MILSLYIYCLAIILVIHEILDLSMFFVDAVKVARIFTKIEAIFAVKNNMKLLLIRR